LLKNYRKIYEHTGAIRISISGFLARLPIAMDGLAILYLVLAAGGTYTLAGALSGVAALTTVVSSPFWAKIADEKGQLLVLRWAVLLRVSALIFFVLVVETGLPTWIWFLTIMAAESGSFSVGAFTRRRWSLILGERKKEQLSTAYALESLLDECVFILGPLVATIIATQINPTAAVFSGIIFLLIGSQALALDRYSEPEFSKTPDIEKGRSLLRNRHLQAVALPLTIAGGYFAAITLVVIAFAKDAGSAGSGGILLSIWAFGGAISIFVNGGIQWRISHGTRFMGYTTALALLAIALPFIQDMKLLGLILFLQGVCIGPLLPNAIPVIEKSVSAQQMTQGIALITAGIPLLGAISSFITGRTLDVLGVKSGMWMPFSFMFLSATCLIPYLKYLND